MSFLAGTPLNPFSKHKTKDLSIGFAGLHITVTHYVLGEEVNE